jgi:hypothetical protein
MSDELPHKQTWTLEQVDLHEPLNLPNERNRMQFRLSYGEQRILAMGKGCIKWGRGKKLRTMNLRDFAALLDDNLAQKRKRVVKGA